MEYTQWGVENKNWKSLSCLNPCCNGIYSMSLILRVLRSILVLILVVMEYTQWVVGSQAE